LGERAPSVLAKDDEVLDVNALAARYATERAKRAAYRIVRVGSDAPRFDRVSEYGFGPSAEPCALIGFLEQSPHDTPPPRERR
jgi:hypothetical protein